MAEKLDVNVESAKNVIINTTYYIFDSNDNEGNPVRNEVTSLNPNDDQQTAAPGSQRKRTRDNEVPIPTMESIYPRKIDTDEPVTQLTRLKMKTESKELIDILKEFDEEYEFYEKHAETTRKEVYNATHPQPREMCLKNCEKLINEDHAAHVYTVLFYDYEGQLDALRTNSALVKELPEHDIYKCLRMLALKTSFSKIATMIYRFRYAVALALAGDIDEAIKETEKGREMLELCLKNETAAEHLVKTCISCMYGNINVHLAQFSAKASKGMAGEQELKNEIIKLISAGLKRVKSIKDVDARNLWTRMFLVKQAFCYLNIGIKGEDIFDPENLNVTSDDLREATACLKLAKEEHWMKTDKRRKVLYERARAKICWIEENRTEATDILKNAVKMADKNFEREKEVFEQILKKWKNELKTKEDVEQGIKE